MNRPTFGLILCAIIAVTEEVRLGQRIIEVGFDYLVVEDVAGVTETRISIYSIKAIVRLKSPRK